MGTLLGYLILKMYHGYPYPLVPEVKAELWSRLMLWKQDGLR